MPEASVKNIVLRPISSQDARRIVRALHYSGKTTNNSVMHLGVFLGDRCGGALQFGSPLDRRKLLGLVSGTRWNEMIELNRMALADWLPRNSESRALSVAMRILRRCHPHIRWVVSFSDATQCGDGTIYRASGFVLTGIKVNTQIWEAPSGAICCDTSLRPGIGSKRSVAAAIANTFDSLSVRHTSPKARARAMDIVFSRTPLTDQSSRQQQQQQQAREVVSRTTKTKGSNIQDTGASSMKLFKDAGWRPKPGFQLRYVYFLDPSCRARLTVPEIPFSEIAARGAKMYRGVARPKDEAPAVHAGLGGETPTRTLHT